MSGNPTYYTVNLTSDTGASSGTDAYPTAGTPSGDLLWAITQANANSNAYGSVIEFDPTVFATPQTITLTSTLELNESAGPEVVQGPGESFLTISGDGAVGVFEVDTATTASLSGLNIYDGLAENGGGIDNSGTLAVTDDSIGSNFAFGEGAGIDNSGSLSVTDSTIANNSVGFLGNLAQGSGSGGGLYNSGTLRIDNSTIANNEAGNSGGGVYVSSGVLTIANSTVAGNQTEDGYGNGGGIYNLGTLIAVNTTIAYNDSNRQLLPGHVATDAGGAGLYDGAGAAATLDNTIVASNIDEANILTSVQPADIGGTPISPASAYNLIGSVASGGLIDGSNGNIVGVNPGIGSLTDNGGPTQTIALLPGSPAIDAGSNALAVDPATELPLTTDQRGAGFPRIVNTTVDIGAFERPIVTGGPTVYTVDLTSDTDTSTGPFQGDLRYCINEANANTNLDGSVITFDPAVFNSSKPQTITLSSSLGGIGLGESSGPEVIEGPGPSILTISGGNAVEMLVNNSGAMTTLSGMTISGCAGGGISNGGTLIVSDCAIADNQGGGILNFGTLIVSDCAIADKQGGGIANQGTTLAVLDSTIAGNSSAWTGGGIDNWFGDVLISNSTIADNWAISSGGGIFQEVPWTIGPAYNQVTYSGSVSLYNTIVALNTDGSSSGPADDISGTVGGAYDMIGAGGSGGLANGNDGNQVGVVDPGLGPLADNGGLTETMALLPGSPAIGAGSVALAVDANGNPLTTDQRGNQRIVNGTVDIGAFEAQRENTTTTVTASPSTSVSGQSVTFTATAAPQAGSAIPTPTGSIQFEIDGNDFGSPVALVNGSATSAAISSLSVASHTISAVYTNDSTDFIGSTGSTSITVESATAPNIQSVVNNAPSSSGASVTLQMTSTTAVSTAFQAINGASPSSPVTVTLDLGGASTTPTTALSAPSNVQVDLTSSSENATVQGTTVTSGTVIVAASVAPVDWTVDGGNVTVQGSASVGDFIVNGGTVTLADGTVITGNSPAITLNSGAVILQGVTAQTATNSPTIIVNGGSLLVRNSTIQESTGYAEAAILITGGTVDLGTTASPGGNTFNVNGSGTLIENTTAGAVPTVGDTFENNGAAIAARFGVVSLSTPPSQTANQGVAQSFSMGSLTDTVTDSQSWAVDVNWGDGSNHSDFNAASTGSLGPQPHTFAVPGTYTVTVTATDPIGGGATAWDLVQTFTITVSPSILVLDPSAGGALSLSGNATIKIPGAIVVDSNAATAISASGNAQVKASVIDVHGKVQKSGNASFSPAPTTGAASLPDPLAGLPAPVASSLALTSKGSLSLSGNSSQTIVPGIYSLISVSGNAKLTLNPGIYVIAGGGFTVSGNASVAVSGPTSSVTGTGVMIYNAGTGYNLASGADGGTFGAVTLSGNGTYSLSPPSTGTYAGIVIFQSRDNSKALTISGNASGMTGTIYAPAAALTESGNAQLNAAAIVDTIAVSGNGVANVATLHAPSGSVAYTPAQVRAAYGISALPLDGTGQTIAIVDAYDDPDIYQSLDAFDSQFGLTNSSPTLYQQYGPASSFLTVLNQYGQATSLPSTDPNGPGTDNWEVEEALDVEWTHAIAPGAQIILVEANSQSLSDLMASVATAAAQPGVSVVSMSWGFAEGQAVFAADEATYDSVFNVPGVTFVASTGDYGAADPEYPAFSPDVVAVGGTSLALNVDGSYKSETGWGYYSSAAGALIASGGGISLYEPEPSYQQGVQSTGSRTTPDVSLVADPATGAWIADPYNLDPSNPFEIVGGTSLSAPAWAGLLALVNQGRAAAGIATLNSSSPTETQQALYMLPQSDYNAITSGTNGYSAGAGYNLVTGLGTPVANRLVPDLIAYQGPGTTYAGPTVGPLQNANLVNTGATSSGPIDVFSVFDSLTVTNNGLGDAQGQLPSAALSSPAYGALPPGGTARTPTSPLITAGFTFGPASNLSPAGLMPLTLAAVASSGQWSVVSGQWSNEPPIRPFGPPSPTRGEAESRISNPSTRNEEPIAIPDQTAHRSGDRFGSGRAGRSRKDGERRREGGRNWGSVFPPSSALRPPSFWGDRRSCAPDRPHVAAGPAPAVRRAHGVADGHPARGWFLQFWRRHPDGQETAGGEPVEKVVSSQCND